MVWDPQAPSYRLRYQSGNRIVSLYYQQGMDEGNRYAYINKADLVAIAESLVSLDQTYRPKPVLLPYIVQEGETCTSIAARFGTSIGSLARENNLGENCDFIFSGQELIVPLSNERETLAEGDLNCDGEIERVRVMPNPLSVEGNTVLGVFVETLSNLGIYQEAWRYTVAETQAELFTYPELYKVNDCQQDLAINILFDSFEETRFEIYRWQGETMLPVNEVETVNSLH